MEEDYGFQTDGNFVISLYSKSNNIEEIGAESGNVGIIVYKVLEGNPRKFTSNGYQGHITPVMHITHVEDLALIVKDEKLYNGLLKLVQEINEKLAVKK